ncbi:MAG: HDIG domain-containing protein [Clostridiales bacterium]|jgi:putative nucleotidyltransferase with HDIG domain|nr:HDIG domain-containing protein [Clostridiales bacterium]
MKNQEKIKLKTPRPIEERRKIGWISFLIALSVDVGAAVLFCIVYAFAVIGVGDFKTDSLKELAAAFFILTQTYIVMYFYERSVLKVLKNGVKKHIVSVAVSLFTLTVSVILMKYVHEFFVPLAFMLLVTATLSSARTAMLNLLLIIFSLIFLVFNAGGQYGIEMGPALYGTLVNGICAMLMVFSMFKSYKRIYVVLLNAGFSLIGAGFAFLYGLLSNQINAEATGWLLLSNIASVTVFMLLIPVLEKIFDICTDLRISEFLTLKNSVLRQLQEKAPGTYNHSLMVATLAESCAEAIGENPLMARAAAYYHDVGKIKAPEFFSENQFDGYNPHDELPPEVSANKITAHTKNGVQILKENGFPEELIRIAEEHHGNSPVGFFYYKAKTITEDGNPEIDGYTYENKKPSTKISAIIMICDTVESAVRANYEADLKAYITRLVRDKIRLGQFDECDISFQDVDTIINTLADIIPQVFHSRIKYQKES